MCRLSSSYEGHTVAEWGGKLQRQNYWQPGTSQTSLFLTILTQQTPLAVHGFACVLQVGYLQHSPLNANESRIYMGCSGQLEWCAYSVKPRKLGERRQRKEKVTYSIRVKNNDKIIIENNNK